MVDEPVREDEKDKEEEEPKSEPPPVRKRWDAKLIASYAALFAALVGGINSYLAYRKAGEESVARDSYKTVVLAIERLSDETQINHAEVVSLRQYLLDHIANGTVAAQLDPPPPPPPVIEARPAPIVVSKGKGGAQSFPPRGKTPTVGSAMPPVPPATASAHRPPAPPAPRAPAEMPAEWPDP
jgi:hypothetical protein